MKKQNVRTLSLIVCTFTYLLIGAAIFDALESNNETKNKEVLDEMERMFIEKYRFTREDYTILETVVLKGVPHKAGQQWKFAGAFYYATTVLTTIGYGHSTPHTIGGKLFTMAYALVGIPLGLVMFQSIGERLNNFSSFVIRNVKRVLKCGNVEASEINLIFVVFTLSSITIAGGAAAFSKYEGWTYFDSVYYCFVTLTTIGFGDMVALQQDNALDAKPEYVAFALIFILFGLAIVAASLNLLVLRLVTLNTEDERRDEAEALQAAQGAVRLEGDVITANGSIISGHLPKEFSGSLLDLNSVCSCSCQCPSCFPTRSSVRHRSSAHRHSYASYYTPGAGKATGEYGTLVGGSSASFSHLGNTALTVDSPQRRLSQIQPEWQVISPLSSSAPTEYPSGGGVIYGVGSPIQIIRESDSASMTIARRSRVSLRGLVRRIRSLKRRIVQGNRPRYNVNVRRASNKSSIAVSHMNIRNTPPEKRTRRVSRVLPPVEVFTDPPLEDTGMFWGTIELTEKRASV